VPVRNVQIRVNARRGWQLCSHVGQAGAQRHKRQCVTASMCPTLFCLCCPYCREFHGHTAKVWSPVYTLSHSILGV
jgi:hypothetical protein